MITNFKIKPYIQTISLIALILLIQYPLVECLDHLSFNDPLPQQSMDSKHYSQLITQSLGPVLGPKDTIYIINYTQHDYAAVLANGFIFNYLFPNSSIVVTQLNETNQVTKYCDSECIILIKGHELFPKVIDK